MPLKDLNIENFKYAIAELSRENPWMEYHTDNIVKRTDLDIILHQANCFYCMNAGVAKYLIEAYPEVSIADKKTKCGDKEKLGHFSVALGQFNEKDIIIFNLYSQYRPGSSRDLVESDPDSKSNRHSYLECALRSVSENVQIFNINTGDKPLQQVRIGIPWMIGCGIAGGDIDETFSLIRNVFEPLKSQIKIIFVDINGESKYA